MKKEIWKDVPGYDGYYQVSNMGRVMSVNYNHTTKCKVLMPVKNTDNYLTVLLYKDRKRKRLLIHRLVWQTFNGPIPEGLQINHIDENPQNNSLDNLNLMTPKENSNWGTRTERMRNTLRNNKCA